MIMKRLLFFGCLIILISFIAGHGHATLIDNGGGLIYDTDLNITWYDYNSGRMTWSQAMSWARGLKVGGVDGWRLPQTLPINGHVYNRFGDGHNGDSDAGWNISAPGSAHPRSTVSTMAYLYYVELENKSPGGLANKGPFKNIDNAIYWSGTEDAPFPGNAYSFNFNDGFQGISPKTWRCYALAVHSGNIGATR
jgi:hypothetical protein